MTLTISLLIPLLGTMFGSAFVFLMKDEMSLRLQKTLLGFASGVMVAASVWSLLIPAMEMEEGRGAWSVLPAAVGFLLGMGFLLMIDELTIAYYSLLNDKISNSTVPKNLWRKLRDTIPHEKHFSSYPAVKIGRLAVSLTHKNDGTGTHSDLF